ncbi:CDP-glycerol glycerophosphotransferase family protein [Serinicoccus chungangensis]|nr:CDP-glycerol glycerophosphotransferase family protein [Serinicoccus chungangensis]
MSRPTALFESWRGRYSDSPRAISEALGHRAPELQRTWVSSPGVTFPADVKLVPRHSARYFSDLATCDVLVTNDLVTRHYVKGPRVAYLQTWHGSPLKVIGLDESRPKYRRAKAHLRRMRRDVAKWDYLLSPSKAVSDIFRGAFAFDGEILEFGYPRNDVLARPDEHVRQLARDRMGLTDDQLVVLYAPTWRDDAHLEGGGFYHPSLIDWDTLLSQLPEKTVILSRMHQHVTTPVTPRSRGDVRDVSRVDDLSALMLASDVLVSDYSSIIFDYAVSGRPIVLHAPDLVHYRDVVRGLYFDFESWAPGPVTTNTGELADVLSSVPSAAKDHSERYRDFVATYCTFEDGQASRRVVDLLVDRHLT